MSTCSYNGGDCTLINDLSGYPCQLHTGDNTLRLTNFLSLQEKHNRLKRLKRLSELEVAMCRSLGESPQLEAVLQAGLVPSEDELQNYRGRVGRLEQKKVGVGGEGAIC